MSLYNMMFGQNPMSYLLLAALKLTPDDFGRFRDAWIQDGKIAVYTRCGGGNREGYQDMFEAMEVHPNYDSDRDDDFDCTYATLFFNFPDEYREPLSKIEEEPSGDERWKKLFEALQESQTQTKQDVLPLKE